MDRSILHRLPRWALAVLGLLVAVAGTPLSAPSTALAGSYLEGIDVSGWQGAVDYAKVAGAGKRFVIAKATEGVGYTDSKWVRNRTSVPAAGLALGAYHFARPDLNPNNPVGEADWFVSQLQLTTGMLVPALDLEKSGGMSKARLQSWVGAWLGEVYAQTGVRPMIYTSPSFWRTYLDNTTMFADQGYAVLWIAHWFVDKPSVPASNWGGHGWTFWQYDDCGRVPGISGCVDLDRFNGLDLTPVTVGADFALSATPGDATDGERLADVATVKQGRATTFSIGINRLSFTLPISLTVSGLPAGTTATFDPTDVSGDVANLTVKTSRSGPVTPVGTYALTISGTANGVTRSTTTTLAVRDGIAPTVVAPASRLVAPSLLDGGKTAVRTRWSAADPSGIASYRLQRKVGDGAWTTVDLAAGAKATTSDLQLGRAYRFRVRATDDAGNVSGWAYGPTIEPRLAQESSSAVTYAGGWQTVATDSASGGHLRYTRKRGATATYAFTGSGVAWVAALGPKRGNADVYVDGVFVDRIGLHASTYQERQVVFARNWSTSGFHTIRIVCRGTDGHPRVDVDALVRLVRP
jgi:lysozyme